MKKRQPQGEEAMSSICYESDGPVAIVTIDRPRVRNAVDGPTAAELAQAIG